eukprot:Skav233366  [mRNA]  locus=scaffold394:607990:609173:+ [translate_table: standard]
MDLSQLDVEVLSRTWSWLPQRQALALMLLASDWAQLVATHLKRLATWRVWHAEVVSLDVPLGLIQRAAPWCRRLDTLHFQARSDGETLLELWHRAAQCLELLRGSPVKQLAVKGAYLEGRQAQQDASPIFMALAKYAHDYGAVESFCLELMPLGQCMQLAQFLSHATRLRSLTLRQCGLSGIEATPLKFLGCLKNLWMLDLSMNNLCLEGAPFLAEFLHGTPQLQTLLLGGNGLGPAGLGALMPSLSKLPLTTLDLSLNGLGTTGIEALVPAKLQLQSLNLRGNWFGSSHSEILMQLLQSMSATLVRLDIS